MTIFDEIQASIARLAEEAGPSVAGIGQRWGIGSGIVLGAGRVLTNAHNVRGSQATVTFADGRTAEGNLTGHDVDATSPSSRPTPARFRLCRGPPRRPPSGPPYSRWLTRAGAGCG